MNVNRACLSYGIKKTFTLSTCLALLLQMACCTLLVHNIKSTLQPDHYEAIIIPKEKKHIPAISAYISKTTSAKRIRVLSAEDIFHDLALTPPPDTQDVLWIEWEDETVATQRPEHPGIAHWIGKTTSTLPPYGRYLAYVLIAIVVDTLYVVFMRLWAHCRLWRSMQDEHTA